MGILEIRSRVSNTFPKTTNLRVGRSNRSGRTNNFNELPVSGSPTGDPGFTGDITVTSPGVISRNFPSAAGVGSVCEVLQKYRDGVGHGMMVMFDVTDPVERACHDQDEDSVFGRGDEGVVVV